MVKRVKVGGDSFGMELSALAFIKDCDSEFLILYMKGQVYFLHKTTLLLFFLMTCFLFFILYSVFKI